MTRSRAYAARCKQCGRPRDEVGRPRGDHRVLSYNGLCPPCGRANMEAQQAASTNLDPDYFARYRAAVAASIGAVLPDTSSRSSE